MLHHHWCHRWSQSDIDPSRIHLFVCWQKNPFAYTSENYYKSDFVIWLVWKKKKLNEILFVAVANCYVCSNISQGSQTQQFNIYDTENWCFPFNLHGEIFWYKHWHLSFFVLLYGVVNRNQCIWVWEGSCLSLCSEKVSIYCNRITSLKKKVNAWVKFRSQIINQDNGIALRIQERCSTFI